MKHIKLFESFTEQTIDMYHGTSDEYAEMLVKNGWENKGYIGGNMGKGNILYLSSEYDDALWFAQEKGFSTVVLVKNIPISYLIFDPEDGDPDLYDYNINNAVDRVKSGDQLPVKLALMKPLSKEHFEIIK